MSKLHRHIGTCALALVAAGGLIGEASAQKCPTMRKINVGVAVAPPNVVHTAPYVAKALGYFAKHCVDANIIQFDGGQSQTANVAVAQGSAIISVNDVLVGRGMKVQQIWGLAPRMPQAYVVQENIKTAKDLKGKRLSATGGGVGGFNWRMGRAVLRSVGLDVNDAQFIPSPTAGRLPGLIANQVDAVALHPEDVFLAKRQKPSLHVLVQLAELMPLYQFNSYGASLDWIARDRPLLVDTVAAMVEANRTMYREPGKAVAAIVDATKKPKDAVEFAIDMLVKNCVWSVNEGFDPKRTQWSIENSIENGDIKAEQKPTVEQVANMALAREAVEKAGGRVTIGNCATDNPNIRNTPVMNVNIQPPRIGPQPWEIVRTKLDQSLPFANMRDTPYYRDCVWEQFSKKEYDRRYAALRVKMREHKLDAIIVPGGPSHWSFGGGMLWLTGHWEWHALAAYVVVPLDGEPTLIYSMGGTHAEAVRRQVDVAVKDVRHSRNGRYSDIMVERLRELKLERGRIGLMEIDPRHNDYMPVNQYEVLRHNLPDAKLVFTKGFLHELLSIHSAEELDCIRKAGKLCEDAMHAMVARAKPGVKEYELRAAAGAAILEGGGDIDFLIIGSTPMDNPALIFGNPRPSARELKKGDIINMELAAGYRGYTAQIGSPICLGEPTEMVRNFWDKITLPGYRKIVAEIAPGKSCEAMRQASRFFRDNGYQSRPTQVHGIDLVTDKPHVVAEHVSAEPFEEVLKPGMIIMAEPNPISADGMFGIFLGHTFIVTETGHEVVDDFPLEIAVAKC